MSFPAKTPTESKLLTFDFSNELATDSLLVSAEVSVSEVVLGTGDVSDVTFDAPIVNDTSVSVLTSAGLSGCKYRVSCVATADNDEVHQIDKDLPIKDTAAVVK